MPEEIKFNEDELTKLKNIQQKYFEIQNSFGQVSIARINLHRQLEKLQDTEQELSKRFDSHRKLEQDFVDEITKKYGNGNLNVENGTFIPENKKK